MFFNFKGFKRHFASLWIREFVNWLVFCFLFFWCHEQVNTCKLCTYFVLTNGILSFRQEIQTRSCSCLLFVVKVSKFQIAFMKSSRRISALYTVGQKSLHFFVHILGETTTSQIHSEIDWPLAFVEKILSNN